MAGVRCRTGDPRLRGTQLKVNNGLNVQKVLFYSCGTTGLISCIGVEEPAVPFVGFESVRLIWLTRLVSRPLALC